MSRYAVTKDGQVLSTHATRAQARKAADRRDNAYGAYVHSVKEVQS